MPKQNVSWFSHCTGLPKSRSIESPQKELRDQRSWFGTMGHALHPEAAAMSWLMGSCGSQLAVMKRPPIWMAGVQKIAMSESEPWDIRCSCRVYRGAHRFYALGC